VLREQQLLELQLEFGDEDAAARASILELLSPTSSVSSSGGANGANDGSASNMTAITSNVPVALTLANMAIVSEGGDDVFDTDSNNGELATSRLAAALAAQLRSLARRRDDDDVDVELERSERARPHENAVHRQGELYHQRALPSGRDRAGALWRLPTRRASTVPSARSSPSSLRAPSTRSRRAASCTSTSGRASGRTL
jgi:hypothetical protein